MTDTSVALSTTGDVGTGQAGTEAGTTGRSVASRLSALARGVDRARTRPKMDMRQGLLFAGGIGMGLGFVAIVLGWYGASHSAYLFQEIPYLISGGLLGVALVAGGGFLFFSAWFVRMLEDNRRFAASVERSLDAINLTLTTGAAGSKTNGAGGGPGTNGGAHHGGVTRNGDWIDTPAGSRSNGT